MLYSGCSNTILTIRLMSKLKITKYYAAQWQKQAGNITTYQK